MIHDLDSTIAELMRQSLPATLSDQVQVSFAPPDESFPPSSVSLPAIDFFLYDVRENSDLRSNERTVEHRGNGVVVRTPAPLRVDFSYLVTAWPSESVPDPAQDEHRLLGEVLRVLVQHRTMPESALRGSLQGQTPPLPAAALQPGRLQSVGEFWQALGGKPKAALSYTITASVPVGEPTEDRLVTDKIIKIRMEKERRTRP